MFVACLCLQRWDFYHQRYANHADSLKFADGQLARAVGLCADVSATQGAFVGAAIVRWVFSGQRACTAAYLKTIVLRSAAKLLTSCRRTLAWTYVRAYFIKDAPARLLYEFAQASLETLTVRFVKYNN